LTGASARPTAATRPASAAGCSRDSVRGMKVVNGPRRVTCGTAWPALLIIGLGGPLLLVAALVFGGRNWQGFGFDASGSEMPRLEAALSLRTGMVVADVGAGKGQLTLALAKVVGSGGHVFSTEIDPGRLRSLRETVAAAGLGNITVVAAMTSESGLPAACCDAIVLRRVYHHLSDPAAINASLLRALRPGGLLAVIDLPPPSFFLDRSSLGIAAQIVVDEVTASGFERLQLHADWPGRGPLGSYCVIFRKARQKG
jgi:SAM-dependent methyltransferase